MMLSDDEDSHEEGQAPHIQNSSVFSRDELDSMRFEPPPRPRHMRQPETFKQACCSTKGAMLAFAFLFVSIVIATTSYFQLRSQYHQFKSKHLTRPTKIPLENLKKTVDGKGHIPMQMHLDIEQKLNHSVVGIPKIGQMFNFTIVKMQEFGKFDEQVLSLFKPYNNTDCQYARYGQTNDGGYILCKNFLRYSDSLINLGIANKDKFGCDLTTEYTMPNYQYDCTDPLRPNCWTNEGMNTFSNICTGQTTEKTEQYSFYTLEDVVKVHNLTRKHFTIKMKIEGGEYSTLRYLPTELLDYVDQIVAEFHFWGQNQYWGNLDIFKGLLEHFIPVNFHESNDKCQSSEMRVFRKLNSYKYEVTLVNKRLLKLFSDSRSSAEHPLNAKNSPDRPSCS